MTEIYPPGSIYFKNSGRNILNPANYPAGVKHYLSEEQETVNRLLHNYGGLIELGCFDATYSLLCNAREKLYIGIDIVPEYIEEANHNLKFWQLDHERFEALELDAHNIAELPARSRIFSKLPPQEWLILFPFNCLGNLPYPERVIAGLINLKISSLISSFQVSPKATRTRKEYYNNCRLQDIKVKATDQGIKFTSLNGFSSIAYSQTWIHEHLYKLLDHTHIFNVGEVGVAVLNTHDIIDETELPTFFLQ
jgi:hypothetical protein